MTLTLSILRCPDTVPPQTRRVEGGEYSIGRGPENHWVLPDRERSISKRHCVLAYRSGGWQIADLSTNGTFLNREAEPIGRGQIRDLRDGDRLRLGVYEVEVGITEAAVPLGRSTSKSDPFALDRSSRSSSAAFDPFETPPPRPTGGLATDPLLRPAQGQDRLAGASINLPSDYDPLAPESTDPDFLGPTQPDHSPHIEDAFLPSAARSVLPEDWDREFRSSSLAPAPPPSSTTHSALEQEPATTPSPTKPEPPAAASPVPHGEDLFAAFLRGAKLTAMRTADPTAAMETLGGAFRAFVSGLRHAMITRATIKGEFRIEQTMIRSRGNNPLKFSADDEDAMIALLDGRRSDMGAVEAVGDALRDVRLHELAMIAAMQAAVRTLLAEFEPSKLLRSAGQSALRVIPAQRKAHAWDAFETLHVRISQALADDFDSAFGRAFARAYERALAEAAAQEPDR